MSEHDTIEKRIAYAEALAQRVKPAPYWRADVEYRELLPAIAADAKTMHATILAVQAAWAALETAAEKHDGDAVALADSKYKAALSALLVMKVKE